MKSFEAPDFMQVDELLTPEELQVRSSVRAFVSKEVIPIIDDAFVADRFPKELIPGLAELGVFG